MKDMKQIVMAVLVVGLASSVLAQQAKVIKVKGQQAIVQFPPDVRPQIGQSLRIGEAKAGGEPSFAAGSPATGSRAQTVAASASLAMLSATSDVTGGTSRTTSSTSLAVCGRYGWNKVQMEYGPLAEVEFVTADSSRTLGLLAGGFFDYNLVPNDGGRLLGYGLGAEGGLGYSSGSRSTSASVKYDLSGTKIMAAGGGFWKWFLPELPVATRLDLQYGYERETLEQSGGGAASTTSTTSTTGLIVKAGFQVYF